MKKTKSRAATEHLQQAKPLIETALRFSTAYYKAKHNQHLNNSYLKQAQAFVNRVAFAPLSLNISEHFACFVTPDRISKSDKINAPLLNPILMAQEQLAVIIFNRDGSYKGFTSDLDYKLWATIVTDYIRNYFHYEDDTKLKNTMDFLINRKIPGFTHDDLTSEEYDAFEKHKKKHRIEVKYMSRFGHRFKPGRTQHTFNQDLKQYETLLETERHADAETILVSYASRTGLSRSQNKALAAQIKILRKMTDEKKATCSRNPDSRLVLHTNPNGLFMHLQLDQTFDLIEKILTDLDLTKLHYFETNQKKLLKNMGDAPKQAYIACETGFALDLYAAQALNIFAMLTPETQKRIVPTTQGIYQGYKLIDTIDRFIDFLDINFQLSQTSIDLGLAVIDSYSAEKKPLIEEQYIKSISNSLMSNLSDLRLFITRAEEEYGLGTHIFDQAHLKSRTVSSPACSHEMARDMFAKKIADHTTFKILNKALGIDKMIATHKPTPNVALNAPADVIDFLDVRQIIQHINDVTLNQSTMNSYINPSQLMNVRASMITELNKLGNVIGPDDALHQRTLSQKIYADIKKLQSEIEPCLPKLHGESIEHHTLDENLLIEMLEQNNIEAAEAILAHEAYQLVLQGIIKKISCIESFMFGIIDYDKQLKLLKNPKLIAAIFKPDIIDESVTLTTSECLQAYDTLAYNVCDVVSKDGMNPVYFYIADILTMKILTKIITKSAAPSIACSSHDSGNL